MEENQIEYYEDKLKYEMDPSDLFDAINNNEAIVVVDARKDFAYQKERIPKAINLPHREMNEETVNHFDQSKTYVCYCDGIGCNASTKGALNLAKLGFKTKELIGGLEWWKIDGYATEGADAMDGLEITCSC